MPNVLSENCIRSLCSGQVITSVSSAVKELVENSIDANSTCIGLLELAYYGRNLID